MSSLAQSKTVWSLEHLGPWQLLLLAAALVLLLYWYARGLRDSRHDRRRLVLLALRAGNLALLGLLLLGPVLERQRLRPLPVRLAVLVDTSASMHWRLGGERSRLERVTAWLESQLRQLADRPDWRVELYGFSAQAEASSLEQLRRAPPGEGSDLLNALEQVAGRDAESPLAGMMLVSDGADTAALSTLGPRQAPPAWLRGRLQELAVPVNTVVVGAEERFVDLAVADVEYDPFAFVRNSVTVTARISLSGGDPVTVPVSLSDAGRQLATGQVTVEPGTSRRVELRFVPDQVGKFALRISVPQIDGDRLPGNNSRTFVTRVVRDKTRVLHVVGRPSWDVRFLRAYFKSNPTVDLVSFYILRTLADAPGVSEDDLSLIPFPVSQLFSAELDTFDLVVLQNFNPGPYAVGLYLHEIAEYVRRGGALCMIGGELSFASGGYQGSALEAVLPVRMLTGPDYQADVFRPLPAPAAASHPVLRAAAGAWARLASLTSYNRVDGLAPQAVVLLEHPFARLQDGRAPVLALRQVGRGRSAAWLTDASWRWAFSSGGDGLPGRAYRRLWNNLVRWLIRDPDMEAVQLRAVRSRLAAGEELVLAVRGATAAKRPARLRLLDSRTGKPLAARTIELVPGQESEFSLPPQPPGVYRLEVVAAEKDQVLAREVVVVEESSLEQRHAMARPQLLRLLAEETGGTAARLGRAELTAGGLSVTRHSRVEASTSRPLLASLGVVLACVLLWVVEWWLRRRWGHA